MRFYAVVDSCGKRRLRTVSGSGCRGAFECWAAARSVEWAACLYGSLCDLGLNCAPKEACVEPVPYEGP